MLQQCSDVPSKEVGTCSDGFLSSTDQVRGSESEEAKIGSTEALVVDENNQLAEDEP